MSLIDIILSHPYLCAAVYDHRIGAGLNLWQPTNVWYSVTCDKIIPLLCTILNTQCNTNNVFHKHMKNWMDVLHKWIKSMSIIIQSVKSWPWSLSSISFVNGLCELKRLWFEIYSSWYLMKIQYQLYCEQKMCGKSEVLNVTICKNFYDGSLLCSKTHCDNTIYHT